MNSIFFSEYYMVALANYASEEFNMAVLESPFFEDGDEIHCFKFYYNFQVGCLHPYHPTYSWNIMFQKWEGNCGLWVLNKIILKKYAESLKKTVGAVWELPAK